MNFAFSAEPGLMRPRPQGHKPVHDLTTNPLEKVRVAVIGCHRGFTHALDAARLEFVELVAICDVYPERAQKLADYIATKLEQAPPQIYAGAVDSWEAIMERDDIDAVYIASPWEWHVPMAVKAMENGKHAFLEVSAAVTVNECWELVNASERTQRHCVLLENCCYGEDELFVLNMVREGVFGDLNHAECGYIHDLRSTYYDLGQEGAWRREYHMRWDGNHYSTHGLGPVAQYLGIGTGDQFSHIVSMSSPERGLSKYRATHRPNNDMHAEENYVCGDMNTSMIKTIGGRSIVLQYDVISPRPYSRINMLSGTDATFADYPARLALDNPAQYDLEAKNSHGWLNDADLQTMRDKFTHPLFKDLQEAAVGGGHGGMDYIMNYRLLDCIRRGATPDSVVYDAAAWSCLHELSAQSVAAGSAPIAVPDFTRGHWKEAKPLGIVRA
ncbi:Gfo/Idh/MocA family oxidoreductase [bacterium]|nr:MAG: Gfo/Idh/MocA family oxidoreductase [bacterium]